MNGKTAHSLGNKFNALMKQTMKKYLIFLASAALMLAVSCNKEEVAAPQTSAETELITVELNPSTKTSLGDNGTTIWSEGDAVDVIYGEDVVGTLNFVEGNTFEGKLTTVGLVGDATLRYPAGVKAVPTTQVAVAGSFANKSALLEGLTTIDNLRAGNGATLKNQTALLQFTVAQAGDVTFEVGATKYTVTGCQTGPTYYACVAPASDVTFVARIGGYLSKKASKNVTFTANEIANLEILPSPKTTSYVELRGDDPLSWQNGTKFYEDINFYILKNVSLTASQGFKFVIDGAWYSVSSLTTDNWHDLVDGSNITLAGGTYDFYVLNDGRTKVYVTKSGNAAPIVPEITECKFIVKVNKSLDWYTKYIYAWDSNGTEIFGKWPGQQLGWVGTQGDYNVYYCNFDLKYNNTTVNYIINNNSGAQTNDLTVALNGAVTTENVESSDKKN